MACIYLSQIIKGIVLQMIGIGEISEFDHCAHWASTVVSSRPIMSSKKLSFESICSLMVIWAS